MPKKILIVEDDKLQRQMLETLILRKLQFTSVSAEHGRAALDILAQDHDKSIILVIMDLNMPVMGGQETLQIIHQTYPYLPVIMLTGSTEIKDAVNAMKAGAIDFIAKPFQGERIVTTIENSIKFSNLKQEVTRLRKEQSGTYDFTNLIGYDQGLKDCVEISKKVSATDIPALITGATGTGKELFAHAIHGESHRSGHNFIAVNCGAIPSELIESTLFGHEKGAFTGAVQKMPGKFREAEGGTIFLDEVGELPLEAQVKLLRVLQQKEVETIGIAKPISIDVRIISATHRNLADDVAQGRFREDLYFRLNVLEIKIPSLKERKKDILLLAHYFIERFCTQNHKMPPDISKDAETYLMQHDWPGNVRELENAINRALVLCNSTTLQRHDFQNNQHIPQKTEHLNKSSIQLTSQNGAPIDMETLEKNAMISALEYYNNNITQAAQALGVAKSTFYRKLKTLQNK